MSREPNPDLDTTSLITRTVEDSPNGYPRLAEFFASDHSFSCYRSFGYLHARVLLNLQDKIATLERELDRRDKATNDSQTEEQIEAADAEVEEIEDEIRNNRPREEIIEEIRVTLMKYDEVLVKARDLVAFQKPSNRDYASIRNWICKNKPLIERDQEFVKRREDVLSLHSGREWSGFDGAIESLLLKLDCKLIRVSDPPPPNLQWMFITPELRNKTMDDSVHYYSRSRVDIFVGLIITIIIFILLILPVVAMYRLTAMSTSPNSTFNAIGVLVVFTLLFSAAMSLLTKARRHELFAASAAYCAVLVVFISNFSTA
ncbi:hypothetical protein M501DRAFT_974670 [Patellaria atrata CBS 101060]|uniref:DUF6594 domain-containing protein n=1 Tax=Patellaria atrata CBS 101060 TaxID=1346257 RepID=A0A9P4SB48_9PEZI|nr:hypothetical protein M501DRAFT_974670 [Patellaria atrata CBS 101060]